MILLSLLHAPRQVCWYAERCLALFRAVSTAQVLVLAPLVVVMMILPSLFGGKESETAPTPPPGAAPTQEQLAARRHAVIEKRWRVKRFYARTIYKPGSFPRPGFNQADGTPWTPEIGGPCYDEQRVRIRPEYHRPEQPSRATTGFFEREVAP